MTARRELVICFRLSLWENGEEGERGIDEGVRVGGGEGTETQIRTDADKGERKAVAFGRFMQKARLREKPHTGTTHHPAHARTLRHVHTLLQILLLLSHTHIQYMHTQTITTTCLHSYTHHCHWQSYTHTKSTGKYIVDVTHLYP